MPLETHAKRQKIVTRNVVNHLQEIVRCSELVLEARFLVGTLEA